MKTLSLAVPRAHVKLIAGHIDHKFELEFRGDEPVIVRIKLDDKQATAGLSCIPTAQMQLVADLIHLNGHKFERGDNSISIHFAEPATAKFDPRETIKPVASC